MSTNGDKRIGVLRSLFTFGLRSILLLVTLSACLVALRNSRIERQEKTAKVKQLKKATGEIDIEDRSLYGLAADIFASQVRPATQEWQVYLPNGMTYELCWNGEMTEEALGEERLPKATQQVLMQPGYHILRVFALKGEMTWRVFLAVDAKDYLICELDVSVNREDVAMKNLIFRELETDTMTGQSLPYQQPVDQPLELFRGYAVEAKGSKTSNGPFALWIEAMKK